MHDPSLDKASSSILKVFFLLVKAYIGTGVLLLPKAFYEGGFFFSFFSLIIIAFFVCYGMILLAQVYKEVPGSFEDIGGQVYGPWFRQVILISVAASQIGFCIAYFGFVAKTGKSLLKQFQVDVEELPYELFFILFQIAVYIPLTYFRRIQKLASVSLLANLLIFIGLIVICVFAILQIQSPKDPKPHLELGIRFEGFDAFFGTALYTFEGIGLVVPITQSMKQPEKFGLATALSMLVTIVIYLTVASIGTFAYGDQSETVILQNLPEHPAVVVVHIFYIIAIMMSWALMAYPGIEIIEKFCLPDARGRYSVVDKWKKNALRTSVVIITAVIAYFTLNVYGALLTFLGCAACVPLSFIYPAMLHFKVYGSKSRRTQIIDGFFGLFGFIAMLIAFYLMISKWVRGEAVDGH